MTMDDLEARLIAAAPPANASGAVAAAYDAGRRDGARSARPWQLAAAASLVVCLGTIGATILPQESLDAPAPRVADFASSPSLDPPDTAPPTQEWVEPDPIRAESAFALRAAVLTSSGIDLDRLPTPD